MAAYTELTTPSGSTLVDIDRTLLTAIDSVLEAEMPSLVTVIEKLLVPPPVGVPDMAPADERLRPVGNSPAATDQV